MTGGIPSRGRAGNRAIQGLRWAPFLLCLALAVMLGGLAGTRRQEPDRNATIRQVAALHARRQGPAPCAGRPGIGGAWLVVTCGRGDRMRVYRVDRSGRIEEAARGGI